MGFFSSLKEGWYYAQHLRENEKMFKGWEKEHEAERKIFSQRYGQEFDRYQIEEIKDGIKDGVDVDLYADAKWDELQMCEIRCGLKKGLNGDFINELNPKMTGEEMNGIIKLQVEDNQLQQQSAIQARKASECANLQEFRNQEQQKMATKSMGGIDFGL